jgi:predicted NUDIX family NTP pyrophosphohydrolase
MYRRGAGAIEVFLVHPGGPFWKNRDAGAWSIPKGEFDENTEEALDAARREFAEETGFPLEGRPVPLEPVRQRSGKLVHAWAVEGDCDASAVRSNLFAMEWPPRSGRMAQFPEVDRAAWFALDEARRRILPAQEPLLDQLGALLGRTA